MAKRKVEVFTGGCPVCEPTVELVRKTTCSNCEVVVYDLNEGCETNECREKAHQYNITRVPSVVVDGKLLECCKDLQITEEALKRAGVGSQS
ncbi:MAG: glutaredoxin [Peredibacter sp.]|nr:glutaredoxin [Peredibacter sp.]